ncbi:hypothetical protein F4556_004398 [Kitasatospora gansuensis]|uniref:Secreted protein n=1 Tax=Kitasatospora gansuensis TaxID=258050 RepID=A0A7W7SFB6_9ACTN|nr:hypothetical protein [Kitasatospora gansuensis]MBB4948863.1 hypothetical protein [Kitasatospora gansuensis]
MGSTLLALVGVPALASADATAPPDPATSPPYAVESFEYPGAAKILQERGITLLKGDGHITLATCGSAEQQIKIWRRNGHVCFQVSGKTGYLTMEIDRVWGLESADHPFTADVKPTNATDPTDYKIAPGEYRSIAEGTETGSVTSVVGIRITG